MISESHASIVIRTHNRAPSDNDNHLPYDDFVARALELYEITHHAAKRYFDLPKSHNLNMDQGGVLDTILMEEKLALVLQIDGCLKRWEHSLPAHLRYQGLTDLQDEVCTRQATILHLR
jgi:hypothetical protein